MSAPDAAPLGQADLLHLRDGRSVQVRDAVPGDADAVASLFAGLPTEDIVSRFGYVRRPPDTVEARAMASSGPLGRALVACAGTLAERVVAIARYERRHGAPEAELAIAVARPWQQAGVGTALLERLLEIAADDGIDALWAAVEPSGRAMLHTLRTFGLPRIESTQGDLRIVRLGTRPDDRLDDASAERFEEAAVASLAPLMRPRSIAVLGASRNADSPGGACFRALLESGFPNDVYAVNHATDEVAGTRSYRSLALLPTSPDLVVIAVRAEDVPAAAHEAAACGARGLVVLSAAMADNGPEGAALEAELRHVAGTGGMRVVGPNCLGIAVCAGERRFDVTFAPRMAGAGHIALGTQSGGIALGALAYCSTHDLGLSSFVSLGNQVDVSLTDLLAWWVHDETTKVALLYLESLGDVQRLVHVGRRVSARMPVVALKGGRRGVAQSAASSHTAALAAGATASAAVLQLAGIVEVSSVEELFEAGLFMSTQPLPSGPRVAIVSNAGGPAILAADACEEIGLEVPELDEPTRLKIAALDSLVGGTRNPVDLGAGADAKRFLDAAEAILDADAADTLLLIHTPTRGADTSLAGVGERLNGRGVPIIGCRFGDDPAHAAPGSVPWFDFPENAVRSIANAWRAECFRARAPDPSVPIADTLRHDALRVLEEAEPGSWLDPQSVWTLLASYGIPQVPMRVVRTAEEAASAQAAFRGPVAVKLMSRTIVHKSDVGGIVLGPASPEDAAEAFRTIAKTMRARGLEDAMDGGVVQPLISEGVETIIGAVVDPAAGPLVMVGIGGVHAELWGDRRVAVAPVGPATAREMWTELRGGPLLDGLRGAAAADRSALADIALRVGRLIAEQPLLAELDLNPVRAFAPGKGALVLDARCRRM